MDLIDTGDFAGVTRRIKQRRQARYMRARIDEITDPQERARVVAAVAALEKEDLPSVS
jgi:hypothetical protein